MAAKENGFEKCRATLMAGKAENQLLAEYGQTEKASNEKVQKIRIGLCMRYLRAGKKRQLPNTEGLIKDFFGPDQDLKVLVFDVFLEKPMLDNVKLLTEGKMYHLGMIEDYVVRVSVFHLNNIDDSSVILKPRDLSSLNN